MTVTGFNPGCKFWLEKGGRVYGDGLFNLLLLVREKGSISAAASELGMSYRAAWGKIKQAERSWGLKLVETRVGGECGGGAALTREAQDLLHRYEQYRQEAARAVRRVFHQLFEWKT
ncbi:MAG: winged helix-turn-helix domain-containing protein [Bacillota bacterium]|uniref:winged helix-turn-helix domain-containing protein n=1 Tax=Desulfurispora thermophila TaxID=265470 RepID=UPI000366E4ED|nr:LysR family transcriptional regulator [Desulfurispora thermophila]